MPDDRRVLENVGRLIVDGTNVLHALSRSPLPVPAAALIGRLRAIVPPGVAVSVVLDGSPQHGLHVREVASGVEVRYAGRITADEMIATLVGQAPRDVAGGMLVVTDDRELADTIRRSGGRTVRTTWLLNRLDRQRLLAPAPGRPGLVAPAPIGQGGGHSGAEQAGPTATAEDDDRPRWSPGRGATRKRGNGKRRPAGER
jgi:hypothetical protein